MSEVNSPCIGVCAMNEQGYCEGCFRTIEEISSWWDMTDERKLQILALIGEREAKLFR